MRSLLVIACIALLIVKGESWSWSDCECGPCGSGCVPTKQRFYSGGRSLCYCYCKCSSSPQPPPSDQEPPPSHHQPPPSDQQPPPSHKQPPPSDKEPPPSHKQPPPSYKEPPPSHHQQPPPPTAPEIPKCPSLPKEPVPTPPANQTPPPGTPPSQQQCQWWMSRIDPGCDTFAKLIPTLPSGPAMVRFILGKSCCEAIEYARGCHPNLYPGLDLQKNCYH